MASVTTDLRVEVSPVFERLQDLWRPTVVSVGGASSSKSHSMAQHIVSKLANEKHKVFGITRKTFPALRMSAQALMIQLLKEYGLYSRGEHNKTDHTFTYGTNLIQFFSLDDHEKIKSFIGNYIWMEEATDFTLQDYLILKLRLSRVSRDSRPNQLFMSLNPIDENHWINETLIIPRPDDIDILESTFEDNPFLAESFRDGLRKLRDQDANYHRIYALGLWGRLEHVIYTNWDIIPEFPADVQHERYGVDFGYENPTAVIHVGIDGDDLYLEEMLYQNHLTNEDLMDRMKPMPELDAYCDSAEPQRIEEMRRNGIPAHSAIKSVTLGIDTIKRYRVHITEGSPHMIKEWRGYARRVDKQGHVLEEPVKFNDHCPDAARYGVMGPGLSEEPETSVIIYDTMRLMESMDIR